MFYRVGNKIRMIARVILVLGIICSIAACAIILNWYDKMNLETEPMFYIWVILGVLSCCLIFWLISVMIYGYGELIENSRQQKILLARMYLNNEESRTMLDDEIEYAVDFGLIDANEEYNTAE